MSFLFKKICIASDHAGYSLKEKIKDYLINQRVSIFDLGPYENKSVDYPDYAKRLAKRVKAKKSDIGILVCGSGTGMAISANKIKDIRAAVCYNLKSTRLSRQHNNANIIALGARLTKNSLSLKLVELFLKANDCIDDENFLEAIEFYNLILKIDPKNISALIDKGVTLQILGRIKLSIRCFDKALELSPKNIDALINKGSALHLSEQYFDAIACYDEALKIDPKYSMALAYKGLSLGELGNLTESINCFKKALSIDEHCTLAQISKDTAQELLKSINSNSKKL